MHDSNIPMLINFINEILQYIKKLFSLVPNSFPFLRETLTLYNLLR